MTITFRPQRTHPDHIRRWLAAGAAAVVLSAGAFTGIRALTSSGTSDPDPVSATYVDPTGLGAVFGATVPSQATYVDRTGLGAVFGVKLPSSATYVDPTGLGQVLAVQVPAS